MTFSIRVSEDRTKSETTRICHENCWKATRKANTNTDQFEYNAGWIYARKRNSGRNSHSEENAHGTSKEGPEVVYVLCWQGKGFWQSAKKRDEVSQEKEESIRSNSSGSYELVWWCKDKSEGVICVFREIRSKDWCSSRICAVVVVITPPLPRDGGTAWTAIQVHAVNLIEIRLEERWQPISNQSWVTGSPTINKAGCHWWVPKSRLLQHAGLATSRL